MNIHIKNLKFESSHIAKSSPEVRSFAQRMSGVEITHFGFGKVFSGPEHVFFTTHPSFTELFFKNEFYKEAFLGSIDDYNSGAFLWNSLHKSDCRIFKAAKEHINITSGITIIKKHMTHCEFFFFGMGIKPFVADHFLINHLGYLENLCSEFKDTCHDLIIAGEKSKIIFPSHYEDTIHAMPSKYNRIYDMTDPKNQFGLTNRELECARILSKGYSAKEIALKLNISYRTVEQHLSQIKNKMNLKSIKQTIAILSRLMQH